MEKHNTFTSAIVLTIVCIVAGALLGGIYSLTKDQVEFQKDDALQKALREVYPGAEEFNLIGENSYEVIINNEINGHIMISEAQGYASVLRIMIGLNLNDEITGMRVIEQEETPGLGDNVKKEYFYTQFNGLSEGQIEIKRNGGEIDALTGATISTDAVIEGVKKSINEIRNIK